MPNPATGAKARSGDAGIATPLLTAQAGPVMPVAGETAYGRPVQHVDLRRRSGSYQSNGGSYQSLGR